MNRVRLTRELGELKLKEILSSDRWLLVCDDSFSSLFGEWGIGPERRLAIKDVSNSIEKVKPVGFAVVCTEEPEGAVQRALKEHGVPSAGLYSQVIPRLAAGVPARFHAPADWKADVEYAIMCLPRCGSTLVSRELKQMGAGNPVEHFRGFVQTLLKEREASRFDLIKWWALVRSGNHIGGVFGTKIIYDFWKMAEKFMLDEERLHMVEFLKRVPVVYIERSDKYAQAVSDVIARKTGVWHLWNDGMKESYQGKLQAVGDEIEEATAVYQKFRRSERELAAFLEANSGSIIKIDYEDLVKSPKDTLAAVGRRLGVAVTPEYLGSKLPLQPTTSEKHKLLRDQLMKELH